MGGILLILISLSMSTQSQAQTELPEIISFTQPGIAPEGIEWDAKRQRFLVSSLTTGTIYAVEDDGTIFPLIEDDWLTNSAGIHIDTDTDRLLVAVISPEILALNPEIIPEGFQTGLGIFDLTTGDTLYQVDLTNIAEGPMHFANDVTVDPDGNAYVTNSLAPVVFKITPDGEATVLVESDLLDGGGFGGNGIEYHPDGYLLVAVSLNGNIVKIPLDEPEALDEVSLDRPLLIDGMVYDETNDAMVVTARTLIPDAQSLAEMPGIVAILVSDDNWMTARTEAQAEDLDGATTSTIRDDLIYTISPFLEDPDREVYEIIQVRLEAISQSE